MITLLNIIHITVCIFLIGIVLLQHGKGADMGAAFGGSSQTVFGTDGPLPLLNKITTAGAIIFMLTSITLAYYSANMSKGSVMKNVRVVPQSTEQQIEVPAPVEVPLGRSAEGDTTTEAPSMTFPGSETDKADNAPVFEIPAAPAQEGEAPAATGDGSAAQ